MTTRELISPVLASGLLIGALAGSSAAQSSESGPPARRPAVTVAAGSGYTLQPEPGEFINVPEQSRASRLAGLCASSRPRSPQRGRRVRQRDGQWRD